VNLKLTQQPMLHSERLLLKPLTLEDAPVIQVMASDRRVAEMTANIPHPYPETGAVDWISQHTSNWQTRKQVSFGIFTISSNTLVGAIGLVLNEEQKSELGYWVGVDYWGNGYATEATKRIINFGFNDLGLSVIEARALSRNPASNRVLLKAGFIHSHTQEGNCGSKFESLDYFTIEAET